MTIVITKVEITPVVDALYPTLRLIVTIKNQAEPIGIFSVEGEFFVKGGEGTKEIYAGYIYSNLTDTYNLSHNSDASLSLICSLTFSKLNLIEEIRKGQKLYYKVRLYLNCWETNKVIRVLSEQSGVIEKSAWIEDILGVVGYGKIDYIALRFSELYKDKRIERDLEHFHKAIESYNLGDYDHVLVECRKVIEGIESQENNLQISKKAGNENYKRTLAVGNHYLSLGAHSETKIGARILRHDSEFALLTTLGLLRFITMTLKED